MAIFLGRGTPSYQVCRYVVDGRNLVKPNKKAFLGRGPEVPESEWVPDGPGPVMLEILGLAARLSEGIDHIRVDLYHTGVGIYFGELTPYYGSGFTRFEPASFDLELGSWWKQPY